MDDTNYYKTELKKLKPDNIYMQSIKIYDSQGNETKTISLNDESIPILVDFLQNELKRIKQD